MSDGCHDYPSEALFGGAPPEELDSELDRFGATAQAVRTPYTFLLVDTGADRVLVDLGAGALAPTTGELAANLQEAGYGPDQIDCVVITHAHPDHVGGALDAKGNLCFPKSRYFLKAAYLEKPRAPEAPDRF